jgi:hypothetical protein
MYRSFFVRLVAICIFVAVPASSSAQTATPPSEDASSKEALMGQLTALRDSFVNQVKAEGFQPSLPPPTIVVDNPPSYGRYEDDKNLLHIAGPLSLQKTKLDFRGSLPCWAEDKPASRHLRMACITGFSFTN